MAERVELVELTRMQRVTELIRRPRPARMYLLTMCVVAFVAVAVVVAIRVANHWGPPSPVGDPDPGHQRLAALRPIEHALPAEVAKVDAHEYEPQWDSCDGQRSTYGWDDATITMTFDSNGIAATTILTHIKHSLRADGWTFLPWQGGAWYWTRVLAPGVHAQIQLLGGPGTEPPNPWSLVATASPATHPV